MAKNVDNINIKPILTLRSMQFFNATRKRMLICRFLPNVFVPIVAQSSEQVETDKIAFSRKIFRMKRAKRTYEA